MKLKLTKPIKWGEDTITELKFEELTGKAMRWLKIHQMEIGDLLDLGARVSGNPPSMMDKLSAQDTMRVVEIMGKLLEGGI